MTKTIKIHDKSVYIFTFVVMLMVLTFGITALGGTHSVDEIADACESTGFRCTFLNYYYTKTVVDELCTRPYCGDGSIDAPNYQGITETCDDGNKVSGDGCSSTCQIELTVPAAPSNLRIADGRTTDDNGEIAWNDNSNNENYFSIERKPDRSFVNQFSEIGTEPANSKYYFDWAAARQYYQYRVRACNAAGCSGYSNILSVTWTGPE